jgi:hypothetical protein
MRRLRWQFLLALVLLALTGLLFWGHTLLFHEPRQLVFYLLLDLVFLPVQVLFVSFIVDELLARRERAVMLEKLNMAIGAFFNEVGTDLLRACAAFNTEPDALRRVLAVTPSWGKAEFARAARDLRTHDARLYSQQGDLSRLRAFLTEKRSFLLTLLQNPSLLEHESFTQMLWAVFHLADELAHRRDVTALGKADYDHLSGDLKRAYTALGREWLQYLRHLKTAYPYLFSLAVRLNPFDPDAAAEVKS